MAKPKGELLFGRCEEVLSKFPDDYFSCCVTDPPYGLSSSPDMHEVLRAWNRGENYKGDAGFMGREWDSFVPGPNVWKPIMRTLQPGGHVLSFSGTRTYDLMVAAMDIAAAENDSKLSGYHSWVYGSGFPKSLNIGKAVDKNLGVERQDVGKGFNAAGIGESNGGSKFRSDHPDYVKPVNVTDLAKLWEGYGTALKPAHEPIAEYLKGEGEPLNTEAIFHYITKPGGTERNKGCKGLYWRNNTEKLTKAEYEALTTENEERDGEDGYTPHLLSTGNVWPTVKPIELMRRLIRLTKKPGQKNVILEPFMGSGTTIIAAILEGCDYVGIDADETAFEISKARVRYFQCLGELGLK